jgi:chaperone required for assembly of F1-ATPase
LHLLIFRAVDQRDTFFDTKTYSTLAAKNNRGGKHMLLLNIIKNHLINRDKRIIKKQHKEIRKQTSATSLGGKPPTTPTLRMLVRNERTAGEVIPAEY